MFDRDGNPSTKTDAKGEFCRKGKGRVLLEEIAVERTILFTANTQAVTNSTKNEVRGRITERE